ncbi:MAG TPA: response regulator, partial [Roseateles sp.]
TILLPLAEAPAAAVPAAAAAPAPAKPRRVLVVDDNEDAAESMAMLLSVLGHEVRVQRDGPAALAAAAEFLPQAVFCDVGMPGMDGYEVATRLRQDPRLTATLLVALTGWGSQDDKKRSCAAGFDAHLTKPASLDAIIALMAER